MNVDMMLNAAGVTRLTQRSVCDLDCCPRHSLSLSLSLALSLSFFLSLALSLLQAVVMVRAVTAALWVFSVCVCCTKSVYK